MAGAETVEQLQDALATSGQFADSKTLRQASASLDSVAQITRAMNLDIPVVKNAVEAIGAVSTRKIELFGIEFNGVDDILKLINNFVALLSAVVSSKAK